MIKQNLTLGYKSIDNIVITSPQGDGLTLDKRSFFSFLEKPNDRNNCSIYCTTISY